MGIYFHTLLLLLLLLLLLCPWLEISGADKDGMWTLDGHPLSSLITRGRLTQQQLITQRRPLTPFKKEAGMMNLRGKWISHKPTKIHYKILHQSFTTKKLFFLFFQAGKQAFDPSI